MTKFPDTGEGAIACLQEESVLELLAGDPEVTTKPDPSVEGVWLVSNKNWKAIVYLGGYKDPFGKIREDNDFEIIEIS